MLAIAGPTACNKSRFAMLLAEQSGGEIISVDSGAVYRDMNIGTAKPDAESRARIPHHVVDVCAPNESFNVGRFCTLAHAAVGDIQSRARAPIFVGGTMMYYRTYCTGLYALPSVPAAVRQQVRQAVQKHGTPAMHAVLAKMNAEEAATTAPNDTHRVSRALELLAVGVEDKSGQHHIPQTAAQQTAALQFILLIPADRARLRQSIGKRLDGMFADGLVAETRDVIQRFNLTAESPSLRLAGYRQAASYLRGEINEEQMHARAYYATCQLAKRQLTWLRSWAKPQAVIDPFAANAETELIRAAKSVL